MLAVVVLVAFLAAGLTLFSGFGLGSLLLPAFAFFVPLEVAVAATAVVHLANNVFKAGMLGRHAVARIVLIFGLPGALAAFAGAWLLETLSSQQAITSWSAGGREFSITPEGVAIGSLILFFALFELTPRSRKLGFPQSWLPVGGAISGFLGGLSGHQGALRTAFLIRLGLPKESFIATGILCAILIDVARLITYGLAAWEDHFDKLDGVWNVVLAGTLSAFVGSWIGRRLMTKVTMATIHVLVGVLLALLGAAIAVGIV